MTAQFDPRDEPPPDSVSHAPVNWRLRNRIAAIVANQHRETLGSGDGIERPAEVTIAMFSQVVAVLSGELDSIWDTLTDLSRTQIKDLLDHAGECAEEELAELKLMIYYYYLKPELRASASGVLGAVAAAEANRRAKQGVE